MRLYLPRGFVGILGTPRSLLLRRRRGGSLRPIWALIPGHSLRDLPLVGTRGGNGRASTAVGTGSTLANSSITATRSSSSLEMMTGEVPPDIICKGKEGVEGSEEKWELASYVVVSKLYAVSELCGSR